MTNRRSYLDSLNEGRARRATSSLEEISRSLEQLESRLEAARRRPNPVHPAGHSHAPDWPRPAMASRAEPPAMDQLTRELKELRHELSQQMSAGLRREFETLRGEMARSLPRADLSGLEAEMTRELDRLARAIERLSGRSDERNVGILRLELEDIRQTLGELAREDSLREIAARWEEIDGRWRAFEERVMGGGADGEGLAAIRFRLEQIAAAVERLPLNPPVDMLEHRLADLARRLDDMSARRGPGAEEIAFLDQRLDEISRAIAALPSAQPADREPIERLEARIAALGRQVEALAAGRGEEDVAMRLGELARRMDAVAESARGPQEALESLAEQMAIIAAKIDGTSEVHVAADDASAELLGSIEAHIAALAARLDDQPPVPIDESALKGLELRLDEISRRLGSRADQPAGMNPELVQSLERQIANLARHLAEPGLASPEMEEIAPRLERLEAALAGNRDALLEAARQAAEEAVRRLPGASAEHDAVLALAQDLKTLEQLARRSDERNARTFEAIHDTLLKIVDRLGALELSPAMTEGGQPGGKLRVEDPPPLAAGEAAEAYETVRAEQEIVRSPAEAAAAAATHALKSENARPEPGEAAQPRQKRSLLGGLARVLGRKPAAASWPERDTEVAVSADREPQEMIDPATANQPLAPGSGAPDINQILRRVRSERRLDADPPAPDASRADFIAAARRAAQAAAAEAAMLKKDAGSNRPGKGRFKSGKAGKIKGRSLLLAGGGAVLLGLGGLQLGKAFLAGESAPPAQQAAMLAPEREAEETEPEIAAVMAEDAEAAAPAAGGRAASIEAPVSATPPRPVRMAEEQLPANSEEGTGAQDPAAARDAGEQDRAVPAAPAAAAADAELEPSAEPGAEASAVIPPVPVEAGPVPLREAAAAGDPRALFEIGARYAEGRGVASDPAEAARWYEVSARLGFAPAQYRLANLHEKGMGVERDIAKAKSWYRMAADQGNASAMHNLAVLFAMGADGVTDNEEAVRWFQRAAELGVRDSQFNMGIMAAKGAGMPQNLEESYKWFALVANAGDRDAADKRDEIAAVLTPEQLERARINAELWQAKPLDPEANIVEIPEAWTESQGRTASIDRTEAIRGIQQLLNANGYDAGPADGVIGARTRQAIARFQEDNGLQPTGQVDERLVQALIERDREPGRPRAQQQ